MLLLLLISSLYSTSHADDTAVTTQPPLTIALKYVVYQDETGSPVVNQEQAKQVIDDVNRTFSACQIQFRIDEFTSTHPSQVGLAYRPSSMSELNPIRTQFRADRELVLINTGPWDSSRGLGSDGANAWTMMPGEPISGAVIESKVSKNPGLVAHELGHYLGLRHRKDMENLMNPVIYQRSRKLETDQCALLRKTASSERSYALRIQEPEQRLPTRAPAAQSAGQEGAKVNTALPDQRP